MQENKEKENYIKEMELEEKEKRKLRKLNNEQKRKLEKVLRKNDDRFSKNPYDIGKTDILECEVNLIDENIEPITQRAFRMTKEENDLVREDVWEMIKKDIIEESQSQWTSPCHFVMKKNGKKRLVHDFRKLNAVCKKDSFPLPRIDDLLGKFLGKRWYSSLDLTSGFWNIVVKKKDREKLAFITSEGLYQFKRMPFGFCNAPGIFQRMMQKALGNLVHNKVLVYIDDIIIYSDTFEQHLKDIDEVLGKLREANLKLGKEKCYFCQDEVEFLGFVVTENGVKTSDSKIEKIRDFPRPKDITQLRGFLGLAGYYRKFIPRFSDIAKPMTKLLGKKEQYIWGKEQQRSFERIKEKLINAPVLAYPDYDKPFIITTDASKIAIGAVIEQADDKGNLHPIEYFHKTLSKQQQRWHSNDWEYLAIIEAVKRFRHYFGNKKVLIKTDSKTAKWFFKQPIDDDTPNEGRRNRWKIIMQKYDYEMEYIKGTQNKVADTLSRTIYDE